MKKTVKKLSLSRETVRLLETKRTQEANGAVSNSCWSDCYCTNYSACCSNECGTQLCF